MKYIVKNIVACYPKVFYHKDKKGNAPFSSFMDGYCDQVVLALLEGGMINDDICSLQNNQGDTPLHIAVNHRMVDVVARLSKKSYSNRLIQLKNNRGETPLHRAIIKAQWIPLLNNPKLDLTDIDLTEEKQSILINDAVDAIGILHTIITLEQTKHLEKNNEPDENGDTPQALAERYGLLKETPLSFIVSPEVDQKIDEIQAYFNPPKYA